MTELITEKEWNDFLEMQEKIRKLVEIKTVKLSMIKYGRLPDGKDADFDLIESEFESGCIFVKYLTYSCGESDADQYNLPFEFLWDETYPAKYKEEHEKKKKLLIEKREREEQEEKKKNDERWEKCERKEYERLKEKYEGNKEFEI